ncbi:MAG: RNA polymerase sigma factor [Armatimonadota bacterium]
MRSDEQIIIQVIGGDNDAYYELVQRHQGAVYRLAYRMLNRAEDAEDIVQDTFVKAYLRLAECKDRSKFAAWIRRIAVNTCLSRLPKEIPSDNVEIMSDAEAPLDDPVMSEVIRRIERDHVRDIIARLPTDYRVVIILRYEEDFSYKEIAEILGEPISRISVRVHRAKKMLAQKLVVTADAV